MKRIRYLLDTHIFIWNATDKKKLSRQIRDELDDLNNLFYLSRVSLFEIALKNKEKKLPLGEDYETFIRNVREYFGIIILEIEDHHLIKFSQLKNQGDKRNHKDPFDHLIISQAITEKLCLISADGKMPYYRTQGLDLLEN